MTCSIVILGLQCLCACLCVVCSLLNWPICFTIIISMCYNHNLRWFAIPSKCINACNVPSSMKDFKVRNSKSKYIVSPIIPIKVLIYTNYVVVLYTIYSLSKWKVFPPTYVYAVSVKLTVSDCFVFRLNNNFLNFIWSVLLTKQIILCYDLYVPQRLFYVNLSK